MIESLLAKGLLWKSSDGYVAGPALLRWSGLAARTWRISSAVRDGMRDLSDRSGDTVSVYVREGTNRICVAAEEGTLALRHMASLGIERPMWGGAPSKVLLIDCPKELIEEIANLSPEGAAKLKVLLEWRKTAIEQGFAVAHSEFEDGLSSVAVPVVLTKHSVIAAISVAGPSNRLSDERIDSIINDLRRIASSFQDDVMTPLVPDDADIKWEPVG